MNRKKLFTSLLAVAVIFAVIIQPAFAADFVGSKDVGGSTYAYNGDKAMGMVFDVADTVAITEMFAHVFGVGSSTEIRGVVYVANDAGNWDFVAATNIASITAEWNQLTFPASVELLSGDTYLLAHITNGARVVYYSGSGGGRVWNGSVDFNAPDGSQPVQLAYHYGAWAPIGVMAAAVPANIEAGLIAYFPFEGNAYDVVGGNDGVEIGNVIYTEGPVGQAAHFDGTGFIEAPGENMSLEEWTLSFWFKTDELPASEWYSPVAKEARTFEGDVGQYNYAFTHYYNGWADIQYETDGSNEDHMMHPGQPLDIDKWHHIVATRSASGEYKIYLQGVFGSSGDGTDVPTTSNPDAPLLIGGQVTSLTHLFKGSVDELRIYGRAVTAEEVQALFICNAVYADSCPTAEIMYVDRPVEVEVPGPVQIQIKTVEVIKTVTVPGETIYLPGEIVYVDKAVDLGKLVHDRIDEVRAIIESIDGLNHHTDGHGKDAGRAPDGQVDNRSKQKHN